MPYSFMPLESMSIANSPLGMLSKATRSCHSLIFYNPSLTSVVLSRDIWVPPARWPNGHVLATLGCWKLIRSTVLLRTHSSRATAQTRRVGIQGTDSVFLLPSLQKSAGDSLWQKVKLVDHKVLKAHLLAERPRPCQQLPVPQIVSSKVSLSCLYNDLHPI